MNLRVKILDKSPYNEYVDGDTGVVDGYCRGGNDVPYAIVILDRNFRFVMVNISQLEQIDSLQQEQPSEDLEAEIKRYRKEEMPVVLESDLNDIARHFYELGKKSKEPVNEDLEEAAEEYARLDDEGVWKDGGKYKGFIAGAEWQKEQMLKDAVEGVVCKDHIVTEKPFYFYQSRLIELPDNLNEGDKVKIVIIPEKEG